MQSDVPKVLVKLGDYPMIVHILRQLEILSNSIYISNIYIIVGRFKELIERTINDYTHLFPSNSIKITYVNQDTPKGTGHAIQSCKGYVEKHPNEYTIILSGDVPLISFNTLLNYYWFCSKNNSKASLIAAELDEPTGYGRIIEDNKKCFVKIVEEKDCNEKERQITKINTGLYCFKSDTITNYIDKLDCNNNQNEYYLTDIFGLLVKDKITVDIYNLDKQFLHEIMGVNNLEQLIILERKIKLN